MWTTDTRLGGPECGPQTLSIGKTLLSKIKHPRDDVNDYRGAAEVIIYIIPRCFILLRTCLGVS